MKLQFKTIYLLVLTYFISQGCRSFYRSSTNDIATGIGRGGYETGATYVYFVENDRKLVRALCDKADLPINRINCTQRMEDVGFESFMDYFSPGFERLYRKLTDEKVTTLENLSFLNFELASLTANSEESNALKAYITDFRPPLQEKLSRVERKLTEIDRASPGLRLVISSLNDEYVPNLVRADSTVPSVKLMIPYAKRFEDAFNRAKTIEGSRCLTETSRFVTEGGGCKDKMTNLIWGKTEHGIDEFDYEFWTRGGAQRICASSSLGSQYNWRVPLVNEVMSISGPEAARFVKVDNTAYYWSLSTERQDADRNLEMDSGTSRMFAGYNEVILGTRPGSNLDIITRGAPETVVGSFARYQDIRTITSVNYKYETYIEKLVQIATGDVFEIREHRVLTASGQEQTSVVNIETGPGTILPGEGQFGGPAVVGETTTSSSGPTTVRKINAMSYALADLPRDIDRKKIAVICVRNP